jgi:hypothetical protein
MYTWSGVDVCSLFEEWGKHYPGFPRGRAHRFPDGATSHHSLVVRVV